MRKTVWRGLRLMLAAWGVASLGLAVAAPGVLAKGPPKALPDWPCDTPFAGPLAAEMLWPGAGAEIAASGAWEDDPVARKLVNQLTAGENSPAMAERMIVEAAQQDGPFPHEVALRTVAGMAERGNKLRVILMQGIKQQIIKSHVLAEALEASKVKVAAAEGQGAGSQASSDPALQPEALKKARAADLRMLDDADDTAEHLCRRLVYDENKLRRLAQVLREHAR